MAQRDRQFSIELPEYSFAEREAIALEVIDRIVERTKAGKDKNGNAFAPYSKDYKESENFKIAGKSNKVNLELSGDMLDGLEIIENRDGRVVIGYGTHNSEGGKAEGNILGTYGQEKQVGPKRDFLGIQEKELDAILDRYPARTEQSERRAQERSIIEDESVRLSAMINFDELDEIEGY